MTGTWRLEGDPVQPQALWLRLAPGLPPQRFWALAHPQGGWWVQGPRGQAWHLPAAAGAAAGSVQAEALPELRASMAARVVSLAVAEGEAVAQGQLLLSLEAMKLRLPMVAPVAGRVRWLVSKGQEVQAGALLLRLDGGAD